MTNTRPGCPLNVPPSVLSVLFDHDTDPRVGDDLRAHVATCLTCQAYLASYERIQHMLKEQTAPQPSSRLRQHILAARDHRIPMTRSSVWGGPMWRNVASAAVVTLLVAGLVSLLITRSIGSHTGLTPNPASPSLTTSNGATATTRATPSGWRVVLPNVRLTGLAGNQGLAVSPIRSEQLVGCGLPRPDASASAVAAAPMLVLSDDGGRSWQQDAITGLGLVTDCGVLVDQKLPNTFAVGNADASQLVLTTDGGTTWHQVALPSEQSMVFFHASGYLEPVLENGHLIGIFYNNRQAGRYELADLSPDGSFHVLDATLPYPSSQIAERSPEAFAVDPANPSHIGVLTYDAFDAVTHPTHDLVLFATGDSGVTWSRQHVFTNAERQAVWIQPSGVLYTYHLTGLAPDENVFEDSSDGGITWHPCLPATVRVGEVWFGPMGRAVVLDSAQHDLVEIDLSTSTVAASLGPLPHVSSSSGFLGVVAEGVTPVFVAVGTDVTLARPLS